MIRMMMGARLLVEVAARDAELVLRDGAESFGQEGTVDGIGFTRPWSEGFRRTEVGRP